MLPFNLLTAFSLASYPLPLVGIMGSLFGLASSRVAVSTIPSESSAVCFWTYSSVLIFMFKGRIIVILQMGVSFAVLNSQDFCSIARLLSLHFTVLESHMMDGFPQRHEAPAAVLLLITQYKRCQWGI